MGAESPPPLQLEGPLRRKRRIAIAGIWIGAILALGPLWGTLGTIVGMMKTFDAIGRMGRTDGEVAGGITQSLVATEIGTLIFPVGALVLVVSILGLRKLKQTGEAIQSVDPTPVTAPRISGSHSQD